MGELQCSLWPLGAALPIPTSCRLARPSLIGLICSDQRVSPLHSCVNLHNQQHVLVMCAVAFYMMENYPLDVGAEFMAGIIQVCESTRTA